MGGLHRLRPQRTWRTERRKEFAARGSRAAAGKLFAPAGCSHEARGAAAPCQDAQPAKDAMEAPLLPFRKETWPARHRCGTALQGAVPGAGKANLPTTGENAPAAACDPRMKARCGNFIVRPSGVSVIRPSWRRTAYRQRRERHRFAQPSAASRGVAHGVPPIATGRTNPKAERTSPRRKGVRDRRRNFNVRSHRWAQAPAVASGNSLLETVT
jgi:hypothetical protein